MSQKGYRYINSLKVRSQHCKAISKKKKINESQMIQSSSQLNQKLASALFLTKGAFKNADWPIC